MTVGAEDIERIGRASLAPYFARLCDRPAWRWCGRVVEANGQTIESDGPVCSVGECCEIVDREGVRHQAEVIGFRGKRVLAMPLRATQGIRYGDAILATSQTPGIAVSERMAGRVLDAIGSPLDEIGSIAAERMWRLDGAVPHPMKRVTITEPLQTGVKVLDGMLTVGRGQRIGIFGGSGVGKSTLIGMMTRNTEADLTVVGLVGERGREVRDFIEDSLGEDGRRRSVVVVSTSDQSPLLRMRAAMAATSVAEFYAAQGKHVLLVLDSLTRYAMAAREIGLAAGEPPASKGYTPSVFTRLAKLVERAGNFEKGSVTAFYTVLMEGDDQQDPIVDAVRSFLDGHVVLSRRMASAGWYPPVDVLDSLSRLMPAVTTNEHRTKAMKARRLLAAHARSEDLIRIGAYKAGTDEELDRALSAMPGLRRFLEQGSTERVTMAETVAQLAAMEL
ncbi:FliI/YscN family ATPase [Edaphobacter bradus]|uniref:FliI/YscN family ATPase n=1 Tax=Edaphobacter bradus TaxID=2259016 RepID=UPI0021E09422|nr:FliI/YscN family ATPase [Edaphobacter bradus]